MGIFGSDHEPGEDERGDSPGAGSGDGGTLGTPGDSNVEDVPSNDGDTMVVSGGGVAEPSEDDASAAGERGLG